MSSFNANDGIPAAADHWLLTDLLRGEWGFKGFVVSDWEGVQEVVDWVTPRTTWARLSPRSRRATTWR